MRKSIDGLAAIAQHVIKQDPTNLHLFVFCSRNRSKIKILYWGGNGFWLLYKRLERGSFEMPRTSGTAQHLELDATELAMLLGGVSLASAKRRKRYSIAS